MSNANEIVALQRISESLVTQSQSEDLRREYFEHHPQSAVPPMTQAYHVTSVITELGERVRAQRREQQ